MANTNSILWAQTPDYLNMSRTQLQPGDLTAYNPPRRTGASPADVTSFKAGHSRLTVHNMPDVLYMIWPTVEWQQHLALPKPPQKVDLVTNLPMFEHAPRPGCTPRPLLDWPILRGIDKIGTREEWLFFVTMLRLEPGLGWADFDMRMDYVGDRASKTQQAFINNIQSRSRKARVKFSILSWRVNSVDLQPVTNKKVLDRLTQYQIDNKWTRGMTPGLIHPLLPDIPANRIPVPGNRSRSSILPASSGSSSNAASSTSAPRPSGKRKIETSDLDADGWTDSEYEPVTDEWRDFDPEPRPLRDSKRAKKAPSSPEATDRSSSSPSLRLAPLNKVECYNGGRGQSSST